MKTIPPEDLVCFSELPENSGLIVDLAYARDDNYLFNERIYKPDAKLSLHGYLAEIVIIAGALARDQYGLQLVLYDGLRTIEAQARMLETRAVKANPNWVEREPRLLSPPGAGGHPRGMAIDVALADSDGKLLDMGTPFDYLAENPEAEANPAHRLHPQDVRAAINRGILDSIMLGAAYEADLELFPLPQEWWDYRLPPDFYEEYAPISEQNLPELFRLMA